MAQREIIQATCPLCSADAAYYDIDHGDRFYYKCPTCTKFIITDIAEDKIRQAGAAPAISAAAIAATQGNDTQVLEIRYGYGADETAGISAKVVSKADYPGI